MNRKELGRFRKFIRYMLWVRPDEFGLVPDRDGFFSLKEFLQALREEPDWSYIQRGDLLQLLHLTDATELEMDERRIRFKGIGENPQAIPVSEPPELLYHCIRPRAHQAVVQRGLHPTRHQWVVLAVSPELAIRIGRRICPEPVLVRVMAQKAASNGIQFWTYGVHLFLSGPIDSHWLLVPPLKEPNERPRPSKQRSRPKSPALPEMPGSFLLDPTRDLFPPAPPYPQKDGRLRRKARRERSHKPKHKKHSH